MLYVVCWHQSTAFASGKKLQAHWKMYLKMIYSSFGFYSFSLNIVIVEFSEISIA